MYFLPRADFTDSTDHKNLCNSCDLWEYFNKNEAPFFLKI